MTAAHEPPSEEVLTPQGAGWLARAHHGSNGGAAQVKHGNCPFCARSRHSDSARRQTFDQHCRKVADRQGGAAMVLSPSHEDTSCIQLQ